MSEKLMAGVVTAAIIAPLCSVCILGAVVLGSFLGGLAGWFGGLDPMVTTGFALATGAVFVGFSKRRSGTALKAKPKSATAAIPPTHYTE